ncbi:hypothetical protein PPYR_03326 [Photinus pyralis]|uniref:DUF4806 domain-containing protein n=1 Tax=Photinus pyralis TaxID=7054 RepID=A0A1Y1KSK2_PHOPY|nr:uncharacterized protein LOC116162020 [Photinus pyralis]XP_031331392.1 uncharacterized protein LOC116162020 [Photinus pyralis]XP_031331393.1 uncharacterized protein LOC116162020 [Photinus pyralis]XP_031331396.1 uncharacterized protein LOC116162020 [Photinus pyralis]KAB0791526.1 hypothetical protein PPYR_03326 [Photinus pyralis]
MNSTGSGSNPAPPNCDHRQYATVADVESCLKLLKDLTLKVDKISRAVVPANQAGGGDEFSQRFPIATKEAFDDLEAALRDSSYANGFVEHFVGHYEQMGKQLDSTKLMYYLLDLMLSKDFVHACSWTGASTKKDTTKFAFEKYTNFLKQFDRVIKLASSNHKITDTCSFIKQKALTNSGQRVKNERAKAERRDPTL